MKVRIVCRRQPTIESLFLRIQPASVGLAKYLDVEYSSSRSGS